MLTGMTTLKPKLRWFQFRLRTLLVVVSVVALVLSWYVPRYRLVENQRHVTCAVGPCGGTVFYESGQPENYFLSPLPSLWYEAISGPQHTIIAVDVGNGESLGDDDIAAIRSLHLQCVFYDADTIDASTLQKLQQALPQCEFNKSGRRKF